MQIQCASLEILLREGESPRGVSPRGARRTVRETLASYGSHRGATACPRPVCEEFWRTARDPRQPVPCTPGMVTQFLVFLSGPADQRAVKLSPHWVKCCAVVPPIVLEPAPNYRIVKAGQFLEVQMTFMLKSPSSNRVSHGFCCFCRNRRTETGEDFPNATSRLSRMKFVSKKIELLIGVSSLPPVILAIDDPRFLRMEFQPTVRQPLRNCRPHPLSLLLASAVHDGSSSPGELHPQALTDSGLERLRSSGSYRPVAARCSNGQ